MTFIHIADLHANRSRLEQCLKALDTIYKYILEQEEKPYLLIAGDFWDSAIQNTENSGFTEYVAAMQKIIDITKVFFIYGTPSHENAGSLEVFKHLGAKVYDKLHFESFDDFELVAIPEPRRASYISSSTEETNRLINKDIEDFLLGLPDKEKPRIVMYHGEIEGAVYQNNMVASSPIAINKKLLKKINADYIAVGHIHEPQFLWDNCAYSGSCCPVNAGEHHDACFNVINITDKVSVKKISFGFPVNITEYALFDEVDKIKTKDYSGKNLTLKLTIDKKLKKSFDLAALEHEIQLSTHAERVKINFEFKSETNIRSEQMAKERSIVEKFKLYCDINDIKASEDTISRLQDIQDNMLIDSFVPCDSYELESLSLRGAIGIKDGTGLDEFNIDFTQFRSGIVLLAAANGKGKTTVLENCHPFPRMLTRSGSLKDHFCLHESHRILVYRTSSGKKIRISMLIDGTKTSNLTRYFVETKEGDSEWKPNRAVDGTYDSYVEWVTATFGTVDMFLRTSFYANKQVKGIPDLASATKTEKMSIFSNLAGIDYLSVISDMAKERAKAAEDIIKEIKKDVKDYDKVKIRIDELEELIAYNTELIEKENKQLDEDRIELEDLEEKQKAFLEAVGSSNILRRELVDKRNELVENGKKIDSLKNNIYELEKELEDIDLYKEQIEWWNNSIEQEDEIRSNKEKVQEEIQKKSTDRTQVQLTENKLIEEQSELREQLATLDGEVKVLRNSLKDINDICPVCGEKLSAHKKEELLKDNEIINSKIKEKEKAKEALNDSVADFRDRINSTKKKVSDINDQISHLSDKVQEFIDDLNQISEYRLTVDIDKAKHVVNEVQDLVNKDSKELQELFKKGEQLETSIKEIEDEMGSIPDDYSDKIAKLKRGMTNSQNNVANWIAEKNQAEIALKELKEKINLIKEVDEKLKVHNADFKAYSLIQKAFSNTGIQALELDSAAPEISLTANQILSSTYGDRFTISFDTQRETKDKRTIDDFVINIFDSKSGRTKKLDILSGGETVWIKNALYYAFSVVRSRRSGFCFKTRFLDESDGTLDSDARIKYLNMIEAAHRACNANLTLLVTHSQEIKDIVDQKIELT